MLCYIQKTIEKMTSQWFFCCIRLLIQSKKTTELLMQFGRFFVLVPKAGLEPAQKAILRVGIKPFTLQLV